MSKTKTNKTKQVRGPGNLRAMGKNKVLWKCTYLKNVPCLFPYGYVRYFCWNIYRGCLPFIKKIPESLVGNFRSVRMVRVVYHLPQISGLRRRARLDSSFNMKLDGAKIPNGTSQPGSRDFLFKISVCPGNFPVGRTKKSFTIYIPTGISGNLWEMVNNQNYAVLVDFPWLGLSTHFTD